jgi:hypothetical protein
MTVYCFVADRSIPVGDCFGNSLAGLEWGNRLGQWITASESVSLKECMAVIPCQNYVVMTALIGEEILEVEKPKEMRSPVEKGELGWMQVEAVVPEGQRMLLNGYQQILHDREIGLKIVARHSSYEV